MAISQVIKVFREQTAVPCTTADANCGLRCLNYPPATQPGSRVSQCGAPVSSERLKLFMVFRSRLA